MKAPVPPQMPPSGSALVDISSEQDFRVGVAVRYVEGMYRNPPPRPGRLPRGGGNPGTYAYTTSAITAASGMTLGHGTVTLCSRSGHVCTADGATGVTVENAAGAVATGKLVKLGRANGAWCIDVAPC